MQHRSVKNVITALLLLSISQPMQAEESVLKTLGNTPVSMLDWGIFQMKLFLDQEINLEFETWEAMVPPFRVDVMYQPKYDRIKIEVGRSMDRLENDKIKPTCASYIQKVRMVLGLDRMGHPYGWPTNGSSGIATQFFQSAYASEPADSATAARIDSALYIQALIAVPASGGHSVCRADLIGGEIQYF
jgi:hypothetical protein